MNRAEEAPIRRVLLSDAVWLTAGQLLAAAALLVGTRLLSEFIPPEIFGQITLLLGVTTLATNFCSTPLIQGAIRFTPEYEIAGGMPTLRRTLNRPLRIVTFAFVLIVLAVGVILQRRAGSSTFAVIALCLLLIVDISRVRETSLLNAVGRQRLFSAWTAADAWVRLAAALLCVIFVRPS